MKIQQYLYLMACSCILSSGIRAEDAEFNLGEIIVSGESPRVVESVSTVDTVTAEDIRRSGARDLNEAIKLLPGVYVRTGGDGTPRIDIRGLRTRQVILLLDGVPINSAIDGQFDPSTIDVANIERIKVTRGTSSLLYGTGGTAGVINIITKSSGKALRGDALVEFGEEGTKRGQISAGMGGDDWNTFVSASGFHRDSFELPEDYDPVPVTGAPTPNNFQPTGDRINSDRTDSNLYANFIWRGLSRTVAGISGSYRKGYYGKPPEIRDFTGADADPFARRPRFERLDDFEGFSLDLTGKHEFQIPLMLQPTLFFNRLDELTNNYDNADFQTQNLNRSFRQSTRSDIYGANLQASYDLREFGLSSAATNCRHEQWDA
ncbi:MAG: TonB-dependent receptor plug domain-containing protein, partial [Gammaproteobacteria bacterium]